MGVMTCSKNGCENIMCSRYADDIGYICYDCFNDLEQFQKRNPSIDIDYIKNWMDEPKANNDYIHPMINLNILFEEV